jgi:hypothetical protein
MLSVVGLGDDQLQGLCEQAVKSCGAGTVCVIANHLFPQVGVLWPGPSLDISGSALYSVL